MLIRVVVALILAAAGLVFGTLGTVLHTATIGTLRVPWGIVVALAALGCLLAGIRLLGDGRLNTAFAALGSLVAIGVLSQKSFGGSVLVTNSVLGWTWMCGAVVIAVAAVAWPRRRSRARAS
jgi:hypothetical protein